MSTEISESIVLRQTNYGDHDRIIGLYTKKFGKVSAFAASARKSKKRFGPALDLFSLVRAEISPPRGSGKTLWRLTRIDLLDPFVGLRRNLIAVSYMSYFADCVWNLLADEDPHENIFDFLLEVIPILSSSQTSLHTLLHAEIELLKRCGYGPRFSECVECNSSIEGQKIFFSFEKGGIVCGSCYKKDHGLWMPAAVINKSIVHGDVSEKEFLTVRSVLDRFVTFIVGRELKSQAFRKEVSAA